MNQFHKSVLLKEVVEFLNIKPGCLYIDATAGGGGHTFEILRRGGKVLAIDRDPEAIEHINNRVKSLESKVKSQNLTLVNGNFAKIAEIAKDQQFEKVDGIIFDLGVSSHQLEKAERGFSFQIEGPLDMRMDPKITITASDIINNFEKRRLYEIFKTYGQEKLSWCIASAICSARQIKPVTTTGQLAQIIEKASGGVYRRRARKRISPATKAFQALRIVVNSELLNLEETLPQTVKILKRGGRLAIISFHSLEDQIVKRFFKNERRLVVLTPKPIGPGREEIQKNPRARSARLRVSEKN